MDTFKIQFGGQSISLEVNRFPTVGAALEDDNVQAILGFGDNVDATVNGAVVSGNTPTSAGMVIAPVTKAASKA